jgi:two-component system capsular synthesis sensor histidine kinase RcsC
LQVKATLAASGVAALLLLEGHLFDLVFMDLHLPGLDGIETALAMLKMQPKLEIIALSASLDAAVQKRCEKAGIKRVMLKPLEDAELRMLL